MIFAVKPYALKTINWKPASSVVSVLIALE